MVKLKHNLIGLSGFIGNGKDLVGSIINYLNHANYEELEKIRIDNGGSLIEAIEAVNKHHYTTYEIKKYADKLKDICCLILGCTRVQLEDREFKEAPIPHLTKYKVEYVFEYQHPLLKKYNPASSSRTFPNLESAEEFINGGVVGDCKITSHKLITIYTTPRDIQNSFGTKCGRDMIHPNIWCEALFSDYKGHKLTKFEGDFLEGYIHEKCRNCDIRFVGHKRQHYCNNCVNEIKEIFPNWLITDVRFASNEGKYITDRGGIVIGIKRKFSLRFPEYAHLEEVEDPYKIPFKLRKLDLTLYERLTSTSEVSMGDLQWCNHTIENNGSVEELVEEIKKIIWI